MTRTTVFIVVLGVLLAAPLAAQTPRDTTLAGPALGAANDPAIATDMELTAVVYKDTVGEAIRLITSDGRGLYWTPQPRVDEGTTNTKYLSKDSVFVAGNNVYVYWTDHRLPDDSLLFNRSLNRGVTFEAFDTLINLGMKINSVKDVRMAVDPRSPSPNDDVIVFLVSATRNSTGLEELHINFSTDSGANFLPLAIPFTLHNKLADIDAIDLALVGSTVYGVWVDNFNAPIADYDDVWLSKFDLLSRTFLIQDMLLNPASTGLVDVEDQVVIEALGSTVSVLFQEQAPLGGPERLVGVVSTSGALSFSSEFIIRDSSLSPPRDVDNPELTITPTGMPIAIWEDDDTGIDEIYTSRSLDAGLSWETPFLMSTSGGERPLILARETTVVGTWCAGGFPQFCETRWSKTAAVDWDPCVATSSNAGDTDAPALTFNSFYTNFMLAWPADDFGTNDIYVGGFRRQTLEPVGNFYLPGSPIHFEVKHWPEPSHTWLFGVLVSRSPGDYFLAHGRNLGMVYDDIGVISLQMSLSGLLRGVILPDGTGTTPTMSAPVFLPYPLYAAAVAGQDKLLLGEVTDFVQLP